MRVLIVDDHSLFRDSLRGFLAAHGVEVVGEASTGSEALGLTRSLAPDVVLMDVTMPEMDGLEATRRICREFLGIKVVLLTASDEPEDLQEAILAGARGYLQKNLKTENLLALLHGFEEGPTVVSSPVRKESEDECGPPGARSSRFRC